MIDRAKLLKKAGDYHLAPSGAVTDRMLLEIAGQFENQVMRKITALTPDQVGKRYTSEEPILATTKYDGEGVFLSFDEEQGLFAFNAPSGRVRIGLPALQALEKHLRKGKIRRALLRAELYLPKEPEEEKRPTVGDVARVSFQGSEQEVAGFKLALLDIIMLDGRDLRANEERFEETWKLLAELLGEDESGPYHRAAGAIIPEKELITYFDARIAEGAEGLVIRRLKRFDIAKVKPHLSIDAVVIGYVEGEFEGKYGIASLLTALTYQEERDGRLWLQAFARVGSGLNDSQREEFLDTFRALKVDAPLAMTDSDGRPIHFVEPKHLVELHGEDLITASSRDREHRTQLFSLGKGAYRFHGLTPFPRMTFATFAQLRPDKDLKTGGARVEQILPKAEVPRVAEKPAEKSSILRREVYVKGEMLRKLVLLQTGADETREKLPYVVYWTDYSGKRKDPLKVTTEGAWTRERAFALADRLVADNVTKGFVRVGDDGEPVAGATPTEKAAAKPKASRSKAKPASGKAETKPAKRSARKPKTSN